MSTTWGNRCRRRNGERHLSSCLRRVESAVQHWVLPWALSFKFWHCSCKSASLFFFLLQFKWLIYTCPVIRDTKCIHAIYTERIISSQWWLTSLLLSLPVFFSAFSVEQETKINPGSPPGLSHSLFPPSPVSNAASLPSDTGHCYGNSLISPGNSV